MRTLTAELTDHGVSGLTNLARRTLESGIKTRSGSMGAAVDGITFSLEVSGAERTTTYSWGWERSPSSMHTANDRILALVTHLTDCRPDPWLSIPSTCEPISRRTR
jgi:hypothetical protein